MKRFSLRTFFCSNFWEERGEKLMTCHLFLDNFFKISWPLGDFQRLKVFETDFCFKKTQISQLWYHEMFVFSESLSFCERQVIAEIWLCFRACNSRIVTYDQEFVMWCDFCVLITITESLFEKFSWRNHDVVENMCSFSKSYL